MANIGSSGFPTRYCPIWGPGYPASMQLVRNTVDGDSLYQVESDRAGGAYSFWMGVYPLFHYPDEIAGRTADAAFRARLTTLLVDQRALGVVCPEITTDLIDSAKTKRSLRVYERANRLLQFMADGTRLGSSANDHERKMPAALAWSESIFDSELTPLLDHLLEAKRIKRSIVETHDPEYPEGFVYFITVEGYNYIESLASGVHSNRVFVAMWFDASMKEVYYKGIEPAIREAGYEPTRVDQEQFLTKIDDKIIAEIRRSAFVVADFTHGENGQRGSVYYEAGFAHGLNIPVIFLCRQTEEDKELNLAFDTQQYPHILWENEEDLKEKLLQRIRAVILG